MNQMERYNNVLLAAINKRDSNSLFRTWHDGSPSPDLP